MEIEVPRMKKFLKEEKIEGKKKPVLPSVGEG